MTNVKMEKFKNYTALDYTMLVQEAGTVAGVFELTQINNESLLNESDKT